MIDILLFYLKFFGKLINQSISGLASNVFVVVVVYGKLINEISRKKRKLAEI